MKPGDRYQLLEKIASGSFATVYRAHDQELGREVAVKQIHEQFLSDPKQLDRYWGEAQLLASLQHPNIVTIYDIVREKGWLIMELMQGNLAERMQGRAMDLVALRTVLAHCLRALKFLHEHGVVHGDIKPSNMMVDRRKRLKIGDFGLARRVSDDEGSLVKGTTKYMAPEVVSDEFGEVGPASDLYSLGFAAYELMCGNNFESLFPGLNAHGRDKQLAWIMWHAAPDRRLPPISRVLEGVPEDLAKVIQKLSTKNPAQRYKSADEALADLNVDLRVVRAEEQGEGAPPVDAAAKRKRLMIIGAFSVSMAMSLLMLIPWGDGTSKPQAQSGIVDEVRLEKHEIKLIDDKTKVPELINVGLKPRLSLKDSLDKSRRMVLLEEVKPGDRVRIVQDQSGRVEFVLSRPITSVGKIVRLDGGQNTLIVEPDDEANREQIPIHVVNTTKVMINGVEVKEKEHGAENDKYLSLKENDRVEVQHLGQTNSEDQRVALFVAARRSVRATGVIETVDWENRKLNFSVRQGATTHTVRLPLGKKCSITLPDEKTVSAEELKADDLKTSDRVAVEYDTEITRIVATRNPQLTGTVLAFNLDAKTVVIQTRDSKKNSLIITPETEIDIGGELAQFDDLREADEAKATYQMRGGENVMHAVTIDATRPIRHDRLALIIGIQHYADKSITQADYILDDVDLLTNTLRHRYCVPAERLFALKDTKKAEIQDKLKSVLSQALAQTQVLVYFDGQAYEGADGKFYLAASDFQLKQPDASGIPLDWLVETLESCASKEKLLILDTCQTGTAKNAAPQPSPVKMLASVADALMTTQAIAARGDNEKGQEFESKGVGSFAWQLAQGFKGAADTDHNLDITGTELQTYLEQNLPQLKFENSRPQTPKLFGAGAP